jgi:MFS family permease
VVAVREPERPAGLRPIKMPISRAELSVLGTSYWWVVSIAAVFTLARFSEAFLILKAQKAGLAIALVPAVLVLMNVVYALAAYPAGALSDGRDRTTILITGLVLLVTADAVLAWAETISAVAIGLALWGLHMGLTQGLLSAFVADAAPPELRGTAFGVFNLAIGIAALLASVIAGALWDLVGPQGTFAAGAGFTLVALTGLFALRSRLPKSRAAE